MSEGDPDKSGQRSGLPAKSRRGRPCHPGRIKGAGVTAAPPPPAKKATVGAASDAEIRKAAWEEAQAVWGVEVNLTPLTPTLDWRPRPDAALGEAMNRWPTST